MTLDPAPPAAPAQDSFAKEAPSATVSVQSKGKNGVVDAVVVLRAPKLEGANLSFDVQVLEGDNAIAKYRDIMGATNPANADAGTIRKELAEVETEFVKQVQSHVALIPTIGTYIAIALPVIVGLLSPNPWIGVMALAWALVYQQVENLTIEPKISARSVNVHPAFAFAVVLIRPLGSHAPKL